MLSECCRRQHFSGLESFDASMEDVPIELIWLLENLVGLLDPRSLTAQNAAFYIRIINTYSLRLSADMAKRIPQLLAITTPIDANSEYEITCGAWEFRTN
jgi:hypothetical protein